MITDGNRYYRCLPMFTEGDRCFTDGDQCLPNGGRGIQCYQPSKSCKNWWKNRTNMSWQHCLRLKLPMNYSIPQSYGIPSILSASIGYLSVSIVGIGGRPDILPATGSKVSIGYPRTSASDKRGRMELYRHQLWLVTEWPRLSFLPKYQEGVKCDFILF